MSKKWTLMYVFLRWMSTFLMVCVKFCRECPFFTNIVQVFASNVHFMWMLTYFVDQSLYFVTFFVWTFWVWFLMEDLRWHQRIKEEERWLHFLPEQFCWQVVWLRLLVCITKIRSSWNHGICFEERNCWNFSFFMLTKG